jgi:hypothetical protein
MGRCRCTECRKRFTPEVTAQGHQRVCGADCRRRRRCKLARARRLGALEEQREDECARQRKHREAMGADVCHEPPSGGKPWELLLKLEELVDKGARLSRATFLRDARRILRENSMFLGAGRDSAGRCHEPPSAPGTAENGSGSVVSVDGVTDRDGS